MNILILLPESPDRPEGLLARRQDQLYGLEKAVMDFFSADFCSTHQLVPEQLTYPLDSSGTTCKVIGSAALASAYDQCDLCVLVLPHRDTQLHPGQFSATDTTEKICLKLAPASPYSLSDDRLYLEVSGRRQVLHNDNSAGGIARKRQYLVDKPASLPSEDKTTLQPDCHYQQFTPVKHKLVYRHNEHATAILVGATSHTPELVDKLIARTVNHQPEISALTIVSSDVKCLNSRHWKFPVSLLEARALTNSELLSLMSKSRLVLVAGNSLDQDANALSVDTINLDAQVKQENKNRENQGSKAELLPNSRFALFLRLSDACEIPAPDSQVSTSRSSVEQALIDVVDQSVIPSVQSTGYNSVNDSWQVSLTSTRKKWRKFTESPKRFISDSNAPLLRPLKPFVGRSEH